MKIEKQNNMKTIKLKKYLFILLIIIGLLIIIFIIAALIKPSIYYNSIFYDFYLTKQYNDAIKSVKKSHLNKHQEDGLYKIKWCSILNGITSCGLNHLEPITTYSFTDREYDYNLENDPPYAYYIETQDNIDISSNNYDWVKNLNDFEDYVYLDLEFSNGKIINWNIVDGRTKKRLGQLDSDELNQLYNFELKYPIKEINVNKNIYLSTLNENTIYKYTLTSENYEKPVIINDLKHDVVVYKKEDDGEWDKYKYESKIYFEKDRDREMVGHWNGTVYIIYQNITKEDIPYFLNPNFISQYKYGEEINMSGIIYLFNDTDKLVDITPIHESFGKMEKMQNKSLAPGEVYKKESSVNYIIIK